jgi:hypothetical protein
MQKNWLISFINHIRFANQINRKASNFPADKQAGKMLIIIYFIFEIFVYPLRTCGL